MSEADMWELWEEYYEWHEDGDPEIQDLDCDNDYYSFSYDECVAVTEFFTYQDPEDTEDSE